VLSVGTAMFGTTIVDDAPAAANGCGRRQPWQAERR
jgi:hypothetical protein